MLQFEIDKIVAMANLNTAPEREGQNYVPAADVRIKGDFTPEEVKPLFGTVNFSVASFRKTFWDKDGTPIGNHHLELSTKFKDCKVTLKDSSDKEEYFKTDSATLSAFKMEFQHGFICILSFNIRAHLTKEEVGSVYEKPKQMASLLIRDGDIVVARKEQQQTMDLDPDDEDGEE